MIVMMMVMGFSFFPYLFLTLSLSFPLFCNTVPSSSLFVRVIPVMVCVIGWMG